MDNLDSDGNVLSILDEILGDRKPARKWYQKYRYICCLYIEK
jgi:hypothetical protein